jgi:hypothetical protein
MVDHVPSGDVGKTNHVIIQNVQVHWFKNIDDLLFECFLRVGVCVVSLNFLLLYVSCCANLGSYAVSAGWSPPGGCWDDP